MQGDLSAGSAQVPHALASSSHHGDKGRLHSSAACTQQAQHTARRAHTGPGCMQNRPPPSLHPATFITWIPSATRMKSSTCIAFLLHMRTEVQPECIGALAAQLGRIGALAVQPTTYSCSGAALAYACQQGARPHWLLVQQQLMNGLQHAKALGCGKNIASLDTMGRTSAG